MTDAHAHNGSDHDSHSAAPARTHFEVRILRQDAPGEQSYWQRHKVAYERDMNVISVLQRIAAQATTIDGDKVAPVAWDCNCLEEVCGACTMVINGRARQACSALVDRLLEDNSEEIELRPMQKFPVIRDLVVDRRRLFRALGKTALLDSGRRLLRSGPRPASVASAAARALSAQRVHELRLLFGCLPAIHEDRTGAPRRRDRRAIRRPQRRRCTTATSSAPTRSAR